jgi:hypothetical protein
MGEEIYLVEADWLLNLVGNAIKFMDAGEERITAGAENGHFELSVSDIGPGIPTGRARMHLREVPPDRQLAYVCQGGHSCPCSTAMMRCDRSRRCPALPAIPIIAASSFAIKGDEEKAQAAG